MILGQNSTGTPVTWSIGNDQWPGFTIDEPVKTSPVRQEVEVIVLAKNLQGESYLRRQPVSTFFLRRRAIDPKANPDLDTFTSVDALVTAQEEQVQAFRDQRAAATSNLASAVSQGLQILAAAD